MKKHTIEFAMLGVAIVLAIATPPLLHFLVQDVRIGLILAFIVGQMSSFLQCIGVDLLKFRQTQKTLKAEMKAFDGNTQGMMLMRVPPNEHEKFFKTMTPDTEREARLSLASGGTVYVIPDGESTLSVCLRGLHPKPAHYH